MLKSVNFRLMVCLSVRLFNLVQGISVGRDICGWKKCKTGGVEPPPNSFTVHISQNTTDLVILNSVNAR